MTALSGKIKGSNFRPMVLVEQISKILKESILEGVLKGGDQLVETELKDEFGVSRSPLREAFRELEKAGLVEIIPRKGTFVKKITRQDIEEHFPVRGILEGLAAREAYHKLTDEDLEKMTTAFKEMRSAASEGNGKELRVHHIIFHEVFINACGNHLLIRLLKTIRMHAMWHHYAYQYRHRDIEKFLAFHENILQMFARKEAASDAIQAAVKDHIEIAAESFIEYLEEQEKLNKEDN